MSLKIQYGIKNSLHLISWVHLREIPSGAVLTLQRFCGKQACSKSERKAASLGAPLHPSCPRPWLVSDTEGTVNSSAHTHRAVLSELQHLGVQLPGSLGLLIPLNGSAFLKPTCQRREGSELVSAFHGYISPYHG